LLDFVRLTLDRTTGTPARQQLSSADPQLRADSLLHAQIWVVKNAVRSLKRVRTVPEGHSMTRDDIDLVGELWIGALGT